MIVHINEFFQLVYERKFNKLPGFNFNSGLCGNCSRWTMGQISALDLDLDNRRSLHLVTCQIDLLVSEAAQNWRFHSRTPNYVIAPAGNVSAYKMYAVCVKEPRFHLYQENSDNKYVADYAKRRFELAGRLRNIDPFDFLLLGYEDGRYK